MKVMICPICGKIIKNKLMFELVGFNYCDNCKQAVMPLATPQEIDEKGR